MPTEQQIRAENLNWIDGYIHAVRCPHVADRSVACDCSPAEIAPAATGWVQEVFKPLPPDQTGFLRYIDDSYPDSND